MQHAIILTTKKDFLSRLLSSRYIALSGLFFMAIDRLFDHFLYKVQLTWQSQLQQSNHLGYWWLITAGFELAKWTLFFGILLLLFWKHLRVLTQSPIMSVFIDYVMAVVLWGMSAIFSNPLLKNYLDSIGLRYLSSFFFWGAALWILVAFLRVKMLFGQKKLSTV